MHNSPTIGIAGLGHVGRQVQSIFPEALVYDTAEAHRQVSTPTALDTDVLFVCVPTDDDGTGCACLEAVIEVVELSTARLTVIRSTVPPGTVDSLESEHGRPFVFVPEFIGEWEYPTPWTNAAGQWPYLIVGGTPVATSATVTVFAPRLDPTTHIFQTSAKAAELCKYMENCWLAMQVEFSEEFFDIATALDVDYWEVRELWRADPRVSAAHTAVDPSDRGFGGHCLPKDLRAFIAFAGQLGCDVPALRAVSRANARRRTTN